MFEIGNSLREARLRQGLDYPDIERVTKIRPKYLRALEDETFETLPAQTYVKGFLRTYAEFLGLDGQLYVDEYNSRYVTREEDVPFRPRRKPSTRAGRGSDSSMVVGAIVGIAIVSALVIAAWKSGDESSPQTQPPPVASRPPAQADLVIRATRGTSQVEVRDRNRFGRERFSGTLARGRQQRIALRGQLWLWLQRPQAVQVVFAGTPQRITANRPTAFLVTKRGLQPVA
jgi:cytoskeleton protein RodZ